MKKVSAMAFWAIPGIFFLVIIIVLICIASRGIPIGTIMIFGVLYFQAIIVYLVVEDKFSVEGILGMDNVIIELFVNPLTYFDSALTINAGPAILELILFAIILIYICYKIIYNNLKHTIKKKHAFYWGVFAFGIIFIVIFGGGMPIMWTMIYNFVLANLVYIVIVGVIIAVLLFILRGTDWVTRPPAEPKSIYDTLQEIRQQLDQVEEFDAVQRRKRIRSYNRYG